MEEPYLYAIVDGRKEKVGNFRIEPPGLFRGRGDHPKTGRLKVEELKWDHVTINLVSTILICNCCSIESCQNKSLSISARMHLFQSLYPDTNGEVLCIFMKQHG